MAGTCKESTFSFCQVWAVNDTLMNILIYFIKLCPMRFKYWFWREQVWSIFHLGYETSAEIGYYLEGTSRTQGKFFQLFCVSRNCCFYRYPGDHWIKYAKFHLALVCYLYQYWRMATNFEQFLNSPWLDELGWKQNHFISNVENYWE